MKRLDVRLTCEGEKVTRVQFRHRWRWVTMTPDNALFLLAHRLRNASDLVFKSINEDLRSAALSRGGVRKSRGVLQYPR